MQVDYKPFVDRLIQKYEGGYGWDQSDPGGPTKYGITCYDLAQHRGQKMTSMAAWAPTVRAMGLPEAEAIYQTKYAAAVHFADLRPGMDCVVMDYEVNSGTRGTLVANSLVGYHGTVITPAALKLLQETDPVRFINNICDERMRFLRQLRIWQTYKNGWTARVSDLRSYCLHLAAGKPAATAPVAPDLSKVPTPKGVHVPNTGKVAGAGTVAAGAGGAAAASGLPGWAWGSIAAVAVAGAIGFGAYEAYQDAQINKVHL